MDSKTLIKVTVHSSTVHSSRLESNEKRSEVEILCKTIDCMKEISVERVLDAALKVIDLFTPDSARRNILTKTYSIYRK